MFVSCVDRRVVKGSGVGSVVECMLMCMGSYFVGGCNVVAVLSMADMVCRNCGVHELGVYGT